MAAMLGHEGNVAIGKALFVSANTVKTHIHRAIGKLGARSRTQAALAMYKQEYEKAIVAALEDIAASDVPEEVEQHIKFLKLRVESGEFDPLNVNKQEVNAA